MIDTNLSFFRFLVPAKAVDDDPNIRPLFENQDDELCFFHNFAAGTSIVTYLCEGRQSRVINVFAKRPPGKGAKAGKQSLPEDGVRKKANRRSDRSARVDRADLLEMTKDFHPSIKAMLQSVPKGKIFQLR